MKIKISHFLFFITLTTGVFAASCKNTFKTNSDSTKKDLGASIAVDEFEKRLLAETNAQLIDVRTPGEFAGGHLKNALNIDYNSQGFEENIVKGLDTAKPVFVYCLSGGRSSSAARLLRKKGFCVYEMDGGVVKWNHAGKTLEQGNNAPKPQGMTQEEFSKLVTTNSYVLVDYHAPWCKPCIQMAPMLQKLATEKKDKLTLLKIDADQNPNLLKINNIESIPLLVLYHKGVAVWQHKGLIDEATLLSETKL